MLYLPIFISIIEVIILTVPVLLTVAYVTVAERKTMASMQRRLGPNIVGYYGLLQAFADALKLLLKEYVSPTQANLVLFFLGPIITLIFSLLGFSVIPYGPGLSISDFDLGILYTLALFYFSACALLYAFPCTWTLHLGKYVFLTINWAIYIISVFAYLFIVSPPNPYSFVSLPLQSRSSYIDLISISQAIALVDDTDHRHPSLEDRVDCYMNGILTYHFPWQRDEFHEGERVPAGFIIAPQSWTHEFPGPGRRKPDFTLSYINERLAEDPFDFLWVESKRPFESFFKALDQVTAAIYLRRGYADPNGQYGGFVIVAVGREIAFFKIPLTNDAVDVTWDKVLPLRYEGLDLSQSRPLYIDDDENKSRIGDIWHVQHHEEAVNYIFQGILKHTLHRAN